MAEKQERIEAIQHLLASIFAAQRALKVLAPEYSWSGLGNLLGSFGELVAINHYGLHKAKGGADGHDAVTTDGKTVIKTNYAADQVGFRGEADLLLVIGVSTDGHWEEIYFDDFAPVRDLARYSSRDNKRMIPVKKLRQLAERRVGQEPALVRRAASSSSQS